MNTDVIEEGEWLSRRIAALEKRNQMNTDENEGVTLEEAHRRIDSLCEDCFIYDKRIYKLRERIAALECRITAFEETAHPSLDDYERRIAALEAKFK